MAMNIIMCRYFQYIKLLAYRTLSVDHYVSLLSVYQTFSIPNTLSRRYSELLLYYVTSPQYNW